MYIYVCPIVTKSASLVRTKWEITREPWNTQNVSFDLINTVFGVIYTLHPYKLMLNLTN